MTTRSEGDRTDEPQDHLDGLADGCGCAEVWEYLSERRDDEG